MKRTVGFVGAGTMATAIAQGLVAAGLREASEIFAMDIREDRRQDFEALGFITSDSAEAVVDASGVLFLSTKPQAMHRALEQIAPHMASARPSPLVLSIAAGVSLETLEGALPGARVIRCMPNTPAQVGQGATGMSLGRRVTEADRDLAVSLLEAVGLVEVLEEELLDAVTGLSGSGPAFVFVVIEALSDAGVKMGLHRRTAQRLATQTVLGSAHLMLETGAHPGQLKDMVASPGGTTIAGLHTLEAGGLRRTLIDAVEVATKRSQELGDRS